MILHAVFVDNRDPVVVGLLPYLDISYATGSIHSRDWPTSLTLVVYCVINRGKHQRLCLNGKRRICYALIYIKLNSNLWLGNNNNKRSN